MSEIETPEERKKRLKRENNARYNARVKAGIVGSTVYTAAESNLNSATATSIDPEAGKAKEQGSEKETSDNGIRIGRERKATAKPRQSGKAASISVSNVEHILLLTSSMLAHVSKCEAVALPPHEAQSLAEAVSEVSKHYQVPVLTDKQIAIANLCIVSVSVGRKRVNAIKSEKTLKSQSIAAEGRV